MEDYRSKFGEFTKKFNEEIRGKAFKNDLAARFVVVWTLLSRVPLPKDWWPDEMPEGHRALSLAPLAGGIMGLVPGVAVTAAGVLGLNGLASAWVGAAVYFMAGWALHLDGWGDLWDGIGSGRSGEELRKVMKDSRMGSFGGASLIVAFGLWTSLVASIDPGARLAACVTAGASARFAETVAAYIGEYPWETGMSRGWVDGFTAYDLITSVVCLVIFLPFGLFRLPVCVALSALVGALVAVHMNRRLGGVNGDVMGACEVATELISLGVWALL